MVTGVDHVVYHPIYVSATTKYIPVRRVFHVSGNESDRSQRDGRHQLKENEVTALRHEAPIERLSPVSPRDAVMLVVLDVRLGPGGRVLVRREQSNFAELKMFKRGFMLTIRGESTTYIKSHHCSCSPVYLSAFELFLSRTNGFQYVGTGTACSESKAWLAPFDTSSRPAREKLPRLENKTIF